MSRRARFLKQGLKFQNLQISTLPVFSGIAAIESIKAFFFLTKSSLLTDFNHQSHPPLGQSLICIMIRIEPRGWLAGLCEFWHRLEVKEQINPALNFTKTRTHKRLVG